MKKLSNLYVIGIVLSLTCVVGTSAGSQFMDGVAAVTGRGGKIAGEDAFDETVELANKLNKGQPPTKWETLMESEGADLITFLDQERVLVGTVESGSYLGVPKHGAIKLFNAKTGTQIWSAKREKLNNGHYALLVTEPLIVVVGRDDKTTRFIAYDPTNGSKKWNRRVKAPDQFLVSDDLKSIISLSTKGNAKLIQALDINTGRKIWNQKLPITSFPDELPDDLISANVAIFAIGKTMHKLAINNGASLWAKSHPVLQTKGRAVHHSSFGILAHSAANMALFDTKDGATKWSHSVKDASIQLATVLDNRIYRVISANSAKNNGSIEAIQALKPNNGKVLWTRRVKENIVSPLYLQQGVLTFTTDNAIYGLIAKSGQQQFRNPFPKQFRKNTPSSATKLPQPDIIKFRNNKLYLVREMAGIRAYTFPSGAKLWQQLNFNHQSKTYSADRLYTLLSRNLGSQPSPQSASGIATRSAASSSSQSLFMQSAQRRYESEKQRTDAILSKRNTSALERKSAYQSRSIEAGLMEANTQLDMAMGQMQAAGDLFNAVVGLQSAIQNALEITAVQGVISRKHLELRSMMTLPQSCFQGNYYLWPFSYQGRGVTLVNLDTGKRHDIVFSPQIESLDIFGIDLPTFRLSPNGKILVMAGVGMNSNKYQDYVKWKYRMPKPSTLAYDLSTFQFTQKSLLQTKAERAAAKAEQDAKAMAAQFQAYYDKSKIHTAAQAGNLAQVKSLLDAGVSANAQHPNDETGPLIFAIIGGNNEVVRLLIASGADVNEKSKEGKSALFWAKQFNRKEMIKMLKQAGAN